jgi:Concanavalin A-like lectin/glucanases superfamily
LPRGLPAAGDGVAFVSKYRVSKNQREWILGIRNQSGSPRLGFWKSARGTSASTIAVYSDRVLTSADLGRWMHVVLQIKSDGRYQWWVNGSLDSSGVLQNRSFKSGAAATRIGCVDSISASPKMFFHGKLDELIVTKSYVSGEDIERFYNWSRPVVPSMSHTAGVAWKSGIEVQAPVDVPELAARIELLGMDVYRFFIRSDSKCKPACKDFEALKHLLEHLKTKAISTKVIVERNPFWLTVRPHGADPACLEGFDEDIPEQHMRQWACALARLAAQYPKHLVGWSIDDFFVLRRSGNPEVPRTFLERPHALAVCRELRDQARGAQSLKVYATIYCEPVTEAGGIVINAVRAPKWWQGHEHSPNWADAFVDYMTLAEPKGTSDLAELRSCIRGVNLYTNHGYAHQNTINACIDKLRALQVEQPLLEITEGVYVADVGEDDGDNDHNDGDGLVPGPDAKGKCEERKSHVDVSRLTVPDGFIFYEMLPTDDGCVHDYNGNSSSPEQANPTRGCSSKGKGPADDYGFCGMRTKTRSPTAYIRY